MAKGHPLLLYKNGKATPRPVVRVH
jgi:hypothetical protein